MPPVQPPSPAPVNGRGTGPTSPHSSDASLSEEEAESNVDINGEEREGSCCKKRKSRRERENNGGNTELQRCAQDEDLDESIFTGVCVCVYNVCVFVSVCVCVCVCVLYSGSLGGYRNLHVTR